MNFSKIISVTHHILIWIYWVIIIVLLGLLAFLMFTYYKTHYPDPNKLTFKEYIWQAAILDPSSQAQKSLEYCIKAQDTKKQYPSQIMQECLSKVKQP